MAHVELEACASHVLDFRARLRPDCLCWTCEPLHRA